MRVSPTPPIVSVRLAITRTDDRLTARRRIDGLDPERGECRVHRAREHRHQVRLPLISTRGRVQIGSSIKAATRRSAVRSMLGPRHTKNMEYSGCGSS